MKSLILVLAMFCLLPLAQAESSHSAKLGLITSFDMNGEDVTPEDLSGDKQDVVFKTHYARINFKGQVNDNISYRLRLRLNKDSAAAKDDGLDSNIDYAWVEHSVGAGKVRLGKQAHEVCAFEQKWGSYRRYFLSAACAAGDKVKYNNGVSYWYKHGDHKVSLGIGNRSNSFETKETGIATSFSYSGKFMDGMLQPRLTYAMLTHAEQDDDGDGNVDSASGTDSTMGLGLKYDSNGLVTELEYISFTDADLTVGTGTDSTTNSIVLNLRYTTAQWTPFFKYENSTAKEDTDSVFINGASGSGLATHDKKTGISIGVEYKPFDDSEFEYFASHQADTYSDGTSGSTVADAKDSITRIGFRTNISLF